MSKRIIFRIEYETDQFGQWKEKRAIYKVREGDRLYEGDLFAFLNSWEKGSITKIMNRALEEA